MRMEVTGGRPWPGPDWDAFTIALIGRSRGGRYGLADGELALIRERIGDPASDAYLYGYSVMVTPPGHGPRREDRELVVTRLEVGHSTTAARLVWAAATDRVVLEFRTDRRKTGAETLLNALPLVMERPKLGRPLGSVIGEDGPALQAIVDREAAGMRRDGFRVTWKGLATRIGYGETTLRDKRNQYGLTLPPG